MKIIEANKTQADTIATLIMEAMNHKCCQYFAGKHHTLDDFHRMMTSLVLRGDSQYSYRNTLVAIDEDSAVMGICVAYDGGKLHELRKAFLEESLKAFGIDHSGIADETQAGEFYIDSVCVDRRFRGKGVASALLRATMARAADLGHPIVGLLVDKGNPLAERLYTRLGFCYANDTSWGGHPMKHLVINSSRA